MRSSYWFLLSAILVTGNASGGAEKRPLTFDDLMKMQRVADPQISPDGRWIAYTVTTVNKENNSRNTDIWLLPVAGGEARQLTRSPKNDERPRWNPNSREISFVSNRDGSSQIYILSLEGGEPRKATSLATGAGGAIYSPDGKYLLLTSEVYPDCDRSNPQEALNCSAARHQAAADSKVKAHIASRLLFRHWNEWKDGRRTHLLLVPADGSEPPRDLTPGDHDAPPFSLGGPDGYAFSPDGKEVCYASNHERNEERSTNTDLFTVTLATGETRKITPNPATDGSPQYSPDGRFLAYRAQSRAGYEADRFQLMLFDRASGQTRSLTETFDRWVGSFAWAPDSQKLYFTAGDRGREAVFEVSVAGKSVRRVYGEHSAADPGVTPDGNNLVFTRSSMHQPAEIYSVRVDGSHCTALSHHNDHLIAALDMNQAEEFWRDGAPSSAGPKTDDGATAGFIAADQVNAAMPAQRAAEIPKVHSWILKPPRFDAGKKYPALLLVHGGPQGSWEDSWSYRWNPQIYAAAGYVVVMPDPRGSTGYGQQFIDEINKDWGGRCFRDLMLTVDYVEKLPFVDKSRLAAAGASFGGFMINWFQGHTDRFKALAAHAGDFDQTSSYYATEELWFPEWEMGGPPYENQPLYDFLSPGRYAREFKTPQLITHGELDFRVPVGEGLAMFTALQRRGIESKLVVFPDEGHWILKPLNSELFYQTVLDWLNKFTR